MLLIASIAARLAWTYLAPNGANFVDLHVYLGGSAAIDHPGTLYSYVYADQTPDFPLPFTYPPFAAVVFYPLHLLPFGLVAFLWQIAHHGRAVRRDPAQPALDGRRGRRRPARRDVVDGGRHLDRAAAQHVRLRPGQRVADDRVLWAVYSTRWWLSGLLVGVAAGIKLTPAISGVYLVGARRWGAAVFSAVVFVATDWDFGVGRRRSDAVLLHRPAGRRPPGGSDRHLVQSVLARRLSRILGHDVGFGPPLLAAVAVTAVLAVLAWRALDVRRRLGRLLVVELFGLLLSPISWTHHWVWLVPLMIWAIHGPVRDRRGARIVGWGWLALTLIGVPWLLSFAQPTIWQITRPWYLAWAGLIYIVATVATLIWIAATGSRETSEGPAALSCRRCR